MDNMKKTAIILVLLGAVASAQAGIYKWTDENGKVHYTQTPPPKEGTRATINSDTFNSVQTVKAPQISQRSVRTITRANTASEAKKTKVKKRTQVKTSRCGRR
jgi:hypothetical protein